ncbi:MAG: TolC family protein, partial [Candidatus Eremiobacteraeota bacterium]|nr:TolC family protein [Candidatus Eremiobacteraeota bacterium]
AQPTLPAAAPVSTPSPAAQALPSQATGAPTPLPSFNPVSANEIPALPPADQAPQLPFPAYGTPAPAIESRAQAGVPQVMTLQQATLIAYARSPALAAARAAVAIAAAPVGLARSAILPDITGSASSTRTHRESGTATGGQTTTTGVGPGPSWTTSNGLNVTLAQLIFDGGRVAAQLAAARATESSAIATYQRQLQTVGFNVATAYYNALSAQRQTQVSLATVRLDEVQENLVLANIRAGTEARADLASAQLLTSQARVAVVRAQATERNQLATFANALGLDADIAVQPKDDIPALSATSGVLQVNPAFPTPSFTQALTRATGLRPDLVAAQQNVASLQSSLRAARLGNFPTIDGNANYGTNSTDQTGGTFRNNGSVGFTLNVPIYDRGVTRAQVAQAQGQLEQGLANLETTRQGIGLNVRSALLNLIAAYAALTQTNAELSKAQENLRSTQAQYRAGVTTLPLLLNAQVGLTQALTDEVTAAYAVRQAEQSLLYAEGANAAG